MKAIIIDDELSARNALSELIKEFLPNIITVLANYEKPSDGEAAIRKLKPDVVFLDVEMPGKNGFQMLKDLGFPHINFHVVFCTGHSHYAMQAFRFSAIDFLLKPIKIEHLIEAVMKVKESIVRNNRDLEIEKYRTLIDNIAKEEDKSQYANRRIVLSTSEGMIFVNSDDIIKLEADGNYTTLYFTNQKPIFIARKIGDFDEANPFLRVHRSFSINPKHVVKMVKTDGLQLVMRDGTHVDVARTKREEVSRFFKDFFQN